MGRLAPPRNQTDMSSFEGALDERWCHITHAFAPGARPICGAPPASHKMPHVGNAFGEWCEGCGLRNCPDCQFIEWQDGA